jgi:hypothetical protein
MVRLLLSKGELQSLMVAAAAGLIVYEVTTEAGL